MKDKNGIRQLHIAGVFCLLFIALLNVKIGLLELIENIALAISCVIYHDLVIFKPNLPMGSGCQQQAKTKYHKENDLKKQPGGYSYL